MLDFATMLNAEADDKILTSTMLRVLSSPSFRGFDLTVDPWTPRPYDGWFHPSTHALWTPRQLYLYRTRHELLREERMSLTGVLAVTAGTFWHKFLQMVWLDDGVLVQDEVPVIDDSTHRRGHADGYLTNGQCLEIKTINDYQVDKIVDEAILKQKKLGYWAQTQDYLDCLGLREMRYFLIQPTFPFKTSEFIVRADDDYIAHRRRDYQRAYELSLTHPDGSLADNLDWGPTHPMSMCCLPKSKQAQQCPARDACPVGRVGI